MTSVAVNPPKTPVTKGSTGVAAATLPNVCRMPGPPAPFVPTPLPNMGKSGDSPQGYSKRVTIDGHPVAIQGASFGSQGDIASKATGGGLVSANTHGPTKFIGPGSMNVQIEGKNVHLLGDPMLNNCGPRGSPANAATMQGLLQLSAIHLIKKTPKSKPCPDGQHLDVIQHPQVPPKEEDPLQRVEAMRRSGATQNEIDGALHNIQHGQPPITHGAMLSRGLTPEEKAAGKNGDEQKIWAICANCHRKREIDHAVSPTSTAECKDVQRGWGDASQRANNIKFAQDGGSVTYKLPAGRADGAAGLAIWKAFKDAGAQRRVQIIGL